MKIKPHLKHLYRTGADEKKRTGYLRLDMNEAVSGLPESFVKEALSGITAETLAAYPSYKDLEEKIALHSDLSPENICLSNGSDAAIKYIFDAYVTAGDKVLLADPTFAMYPVYCGMFNAEKIMVEYNPDFTFPSDDFIKQIVPGVKLAVLVNPNNPTGTFIERDILLSVIKKAENNNTIIIIDEAYFYFYPDSVIKYVETFKNLIVLRTFSKLCAMAAARLGYAAACPEIVKNLKTVKPTYDVNGFAVFLGEKILDDVNVIKTLILSAEEGKRYLSHKLSKAGIEHREGCANFTLIKTRERTSEIMERLAGENILVNGRFKQPFLQDYIRVTSGDKKAMKQFWDEFIRIWRSDI